MFFSFRSTYKVKAFSTPLIASVYFLLLLETLNSFVFFFSRCSPCCVHFFFLLSRHGAPLTFFLFLPLRFFSSRSEHRSSPYIYPVEHSRRSPCCVHFFFSKSPWRPSHIFLFLPLRFFFFTLRISTLPVYSPCGRLRGVPHVGPGPVLGYIYIYIYI